MEMKTGVVGEINPNLVHGSTANAFNCWALHASATYTTPELKVCGQRFHLMLLIFTSTTGLGAAVLGSSGSTFANRQKKTVALEIQTGTIANNPSCPPLTESLRERFVTTWCDRNDYFVIGRIGTDFTDLSTTQLALLVEHHRNTSNFRLKQ